MMRPRIRNFASDCRGMAATEFALLLPVLLVIFFGVVEGSDALTKSRRVTLAANTLADLAAQETDLLESAADSLFVGVEEIVDVNGAAMDIRLVSVIFDDTTGDGTPDSPVVHWSYDNAGGEPYAAGSVFNNLSDPTLLEIDSAIVVAEINYPYTSSLTRNFIKNVTFDRIAARWPRQSLRVQLCSAPGTCTS